MNGNISKRKGLASSVDADNLNYISEKVSEKLIGYTDAVASEEAARKKADKDLESEILKKQDKLTFDTAPTAESENPVTSGGIKDELDKKVDKADGKVLSSNDFTDEDKAKLDKKVDKADGMGLSKIKDISLYQMYLPSGSNGARVEYKRLNIETQSGNDISASYVPHTHLTGFDHPDKCVTKRKLSDELQAEMNKISTKADKSDTYTKDEINSKISGVYRICGSKTIDEINNLKYQIGIESELKIGDVYNCSDSGNVKAKIGFAGMQLSFDQYLSNTASNFNLIYPDNLGEIGFIPTPSYVAVIMSGTTSYKIVSTPTAASTSIVFEGNVLKPDGSQYANGDTVWFDTFLDSIGIPVNAGDNIVWTENGWDKLAATVDLSSYVKNTDYASKNNAGVVKTDENMGIAILRDGRLYLHQSVQDSISKRSTPYNAITPNNLNFAVKAALSDANGISDMTDDEKANARGVIGAVGETDLANYVKATDYASKTRGGTVRVGDSAAVGLAINSSGAIYVVAATNSQINDRSNSYNAITPSNLNYAVRSVPYFDIKTEITDNTLLLVNRQEVRLTSANVETLTITMPETIPTDYESAFSFKSGATATVLSYSSLPIVWKGDDCDSEGNFVPVANTSYEVNVKRVGAESEIVARVGAY